MPVVLFLLACGGPDLEPDKEPNEDPFGTPPTTSAPEIRTTEFDFTTEANSSHVIEVDVLEGETEMLVTVDTRSDQYDVYFYQVIDPEGTLVYDGDRWFHKAESLSYACWPDRVTSLNWPILPEHGDLLPGRWSLVFKTLDARTWAYEGGVPTTMSASFTTDEDRTVGTLTVNVVFTGGVEADPVVTDAVDAAEAHWNTIYGAVDVDVVFERTIWPAGATWDPPGEGSFDLYEEAMAENEPGTINLVLVPEFTLNGWQGTLGISGGIPGAIVGTGQSAVTVSTTAHMGANLEFSDEETRLFAGTMAHEVGHYLGLFHPVEMGWQYWDALEDTPPCSTMAQCEGQLGPNLMFPYSLCGGGACEVQETITPDQSAVLHRYVGVR